MPVNKFGLSSLFQKIIQQFSTFDPSPAYDGTCMGSHIIVLQFVGRIGADQFLFYKRKRSGMIGSTGANWLLEKTLSWIHLSFSILNFISSGSL